MYAGTRRAVRVRPVCRQKMQYNITYIAFVTLCDFSDFHRFCTVFHGYSELDRFFTQTQRNATNHHESPRIARFLARGTPFVVFGIQTCRLAFSVTVNHRVCRIGG